MPIPILTGPPPGPPTEVRSSAPDVRWTAPAIILSDVDGNTITAGADGPYVIMPGAQGFGMAPTSLFADPLPEDDGSLFRGLRLGERDIFLPIAVLAQTYDELRDRRRFLERLVDPHRGPVTVTVAHPDGQRREATGYYAGGMEGSYGSGEFGASWQTLGITIRCQDPSWYGDLVSVTFTTAEAADPFLDATDAFLPVTLGSSQVIGSIEINNPGDSTAQPTWLIKGPGSGFTADNDSTDKSFEITGTIDTARTITVDTRRSVQTVTDDLGVNLWARLAIGSSLWPLVPGPQTVTLTMASATGASRVTVRYRPRYRSAL